VPNFSSCAENRGVTRSCRGEEGKRSGELMFVLKRSSRCWHRRSSGRDTVAVALQNPPKFRRFHLVVVAVSRLRGEARRHDAEEIYQAIYSGSKARHAAGRPVKSSAWEIISGA
jgi:hypothetical protein